MLDVSFSQLPSGTGSPRFSSNGCSIARMSRTAAERALDLNRHTLYARWLPPIPWLIVTTLIQARERVVPRELLLDLLRDARLMRGFSRPTPRDPENTLRGAISKTRRLLQSTPIQISSVWGIGYTLIVRGEDEQSKKRAA